MKELSIETIKKLIDSKDRHLCAAALIACYNRDVPIEIIEKGLQDESCYIIELAIVALKGKKVPVENVVTWALSGQAHLMEAANYITDISGEVSEDIINKLLNHPLSKVRKVAIRLCMLRDNLTEYIKRGLSDPAKDVCLAAIKACIEKGIQLPIFRTFDPPVNVYKKCLNNVIVVAQIPETAHVHGNYGGKCRSSEAIIVDIIGDIYGEKIGIASYDCCTIYEIGDHVKIENFDFSDDHCSTGFHFFCTMEEAEEYSL